MSSQTRVSTGQVVAPVTFELRPDIEARTAIAARLDLIALKKLSFEGRIAPSGTRDLKLEGAIGATVVQPCVVSGGPVTTRIDQPVLRAYVADMELPTAEEAEMPEDDSVEPLTATLDLAAVMEEALVLALPDWPRADGVEPVDMTITEPGVAPMTNEDTKPFAGLKSLRDQLNGGHSED